MVTVKSKSFEYQELQVHTTCEAKQGNALSNLTFALPKKKYIPENKSFDPRGLAG